MSLKEVIKKYYIFRPVIWFNVLSKYEKAQKNIIAHLKGNEKIQYERCQEWFAIRGDETLRLEYDLSSNSVVFDVGGYKGEFASSIFNKYESKVYVFEPIPDFCNLIKEKFSHNKSIKVLCLGLSNITSVGHISFSENSSSLFLTNNKIDIQLKRAVDFIREENISMIDLMKLNIEGAEYDLLEDLIESGEIIKVKNIQVQFHDFIIPDAKARMLEIRKKLALTHQLTYQYEFVWENWLLKS